MLASRDGDVFEHSVGKFFNNGDFLGADLPIDGEGGRTGIAGVNENPATVRIYSTPSSKIGIRTLGRRNVAFIISDRVGAQFGPLNCSRPVVPYNGDSLELIENGRCDPTKRCGVGISAADIAGKLLKANQVYKYWVASVAEVLSKALNALATSGDDEWFVADNRIARRLKTLFMKFVSNPGFTN